MKAIFDGLVADNFAGGGGASEGIEAALGQPVDIAINHDPDAVAMHAANHPLTLHFCQSIWAVDPLAAAEAALARHGLTLAEVPDWLFKIIWFSPDCKHHSKAKGGKPREKNIRDLAWVVVHWIERLQAAMRRAGKDPRKAIRVIMLENVEEFRRWGPLDENGMPIKERAGEEFDLFVRRIQRLGGRVEFQELKAFHQGVPTKRKRLYMVVRFDGEAIAWPDPTHDDPATPAVQGGARQPWRTAAEIIDWSIPCPSIFDRKRPLKDATCRRIAAGIVRYVLNSARPFIVPVCNTGWNPNRVWSADEPLRTVTTAKGGEMAVVSPVFAPLTHQGDDGRTYDPAEPLPTVTAANRGEVALISPTLIQTSYGEREGQAPRVPGLDKPLGTVVAGGGKHALVAAFLEKFSENSRGRPLDEPVDTIMAGAARHAVAAVHLAQFNNNRGVSPHVGHPVDKPISTIATKGPHQAVIASSLVKLRGTSRDGQPVDEPLHTISAQGMHFAQVAAFLVKYYGAHRHGQAVDEPFDTVTSKARFGLVTVTIGGEEYAIVDIGMRMLTRRELARAQGFRDSYILDPIGPNGKPLTLTASIRMIGNSVCPDMAEALVRANLMTAEPEQVAA